MANNSTFTMDNVTLNNSMLSTMTQEARHELANTVNDLMHTLKAKYGQASQELAYIEKWSLEDKKAFCALSRNRSTLANYDTWKIEQELKAIERVEREKAKTAKEAKKLEKKAKAEAKKSEYENTHLYFLVGGFGDGIAKKQLGGFVLSNSIVITNYTADGFIIVTVDKLNRLFVSVNTRVKDTNGGNCRAKKELLSKTFDTIKSNIVLSMERNHNTWNELLTIARNTKSFKCDCSNKRINELVAVVERNASKYDK